ncbi:NADPH-dependent F420 reductase [Cohnella caldifontis]|uniref:NADPH-dependent F420 reductase n=1 Tax=Cohnella caldifontis TaxID=3027471 RepID=UPI0023EC3BFF|nr:NAD(P)-binding domain-containing protein [Cohnella sp. YIM B05605]
MKIGLLGTGRMGKGLAGLLNAGAEEAVWGSRTPDKAREIARSQGWERIRAVTYEEALQADLIIHTLWFRDVVPWALANSDFLKGKILVDVCNPFTEDFRDFTLPWGQSAAEALQEALPETRIAGAFKNTFFRVLEQPVHEGLLSDVYVTANDESVRKTVLQALRRLPFRLLDAGELSNNRTIERMTLFSREMAIRYGHYPYVSYRMFGLPNA